MSKIEWTGKTWNPLAGCSKISSGCKNCYAIRMAHRLAANPLTPQYQGLTVIEGGKPNWSGEVRIDEEKLTEPLRWKKPQRVFVNSMSDLFHESVPDEWIDRIFAVMALCPQHTFQVLTKRAERMAEYWAETWEVPAQPPQDFHGIPIPATRARTEDRWERINYQIDEVAVDQDIENHDRFWTPEGKLIGRPPWPRKPFHHIHLGVSVENQQAANERREDLREVAKQGWLTWVSYEPALEIVDWSGWEFIRWMVIGGESGPGARPFNVAWARRTIRECRMAGVACFVKQLGTKPCGFGRYEVSLPLANKKGGDMAEWPEDLRVREYPKGRE